MQLTVVIGALIVTLIGLCDCVTVNPNKNGHFKEKIKEPDIPLYTVVRVKFPVSGEQIKASSHQVPKYRKKFNKYTNVDYVRGDGFKPVARDNIRSIKNPVFHGRKAPPKNGKRFNKFIPSEPFQVDYQKLKYEQQHLAQKTAPVQFPTYQENEGSFLPLMKPSPINRIPIDPPSNDAVRQYTRYIKYRQKQLYDEIEQEKASRRQSQPQPKTFDGEILYFQQRERELADEARGNFKNHLSPNDFGKTDREIQTETNIKEIDLKNKNPLKKKYNGPNKNQKRKSKEESDESRESLSEEKRTLKDDGVKPANNTGKIHAEELKQESSNESLSEDSDKEHSASVEDPDEDESKTYENFIPFRMYAQVRHIESESYEKPPKNDPKLKKEVTHFKRHMYFSEDGFKHKEDEEGAYQNKGEFHEKYRKRRRKREILTDREIENRTIELLPMALALVKKSEIPNLTGEKLLSYLDELIRNSSVYIPEDTYEFDTIKSNAPIKIISKTYPKVDSKKYPYYGLPSDVLSEMSALRYAESLKNLPQTKRSIYEQKKSKPCDPIDIDPEKLPQPSDKFKSKLPDLGEKLDCLKTKHFGKDPLDNPLFKEEYVAAAIPIPWKIYTSNNLLEHQKNPLITVYDDVISNIRAGILEEAKIRKKAIEEDAKKSSSEHVPAVSGNTTIASFNLSKDANELMKYHQKIKATKLPIFDVTTYYPKVPINFKKDLFSEKEETKTPPRGEVKDVFTIDKTKTNKGWVAMTSPAISDYVVEIVEAPPIKRQYKNKFLLQTQQLPPPPSSASTPILSSFQPPKPPKQKRIPRPAHSPSKSPKRYRNQKRQLYHYKLL